MNKRYQVFVSSTFSDLKDERSRVMRSIMSLGCIPAGMELFPAMDEKQLEFIKKIIDDSDYYLLIIGGRYGSVNEEGISYTEKEYDYAVQKGIPVIAFLHENIDSIPLGKSEKDSAKRNQLLLFREKVSKGRLVQFWNNADDLSGKVAISLSQAINQYPAIGWVRGNTVLLNSQVVDQSSYYSMSPKEEKLFQEETILTSVTIEYQSSPALLFDPPKEESFTWKAILLALSPCFLLGSTEDEIQSAFFKGLGGFFSLLARTGSLITKDSVRMIIDFLFSNGVIKEVKKSSTSITWGFTDAGKRIMLHLKNDM